jgi:hypothetical protein
VHKNFTSFGRFQINEKVVTWFQMLHNGWKFAWQTSWHIHPLCNFHNGWEFTWLFKSWNFDVVQWMKMFIIVT